MGELAVEGAKKMEVMLGLEVVDLADGRGEDVREDVCEDGVVLVVKTDGACAIVGVAYILFVMVVRVGIDGTCRVGT